MEFIKEYPIDKLKVWEKNPRKNDKAADKLTNMIEEYGFINPIIIDQHGTIRAGHTRLKAAQKLNKDTVPVLIYDFQNEAQAIGYAIADNKLSEIAEWDFDELKSLMEDLAKEAFDLEMTGFAEGEIQNILEHEEVDIDNFFEETQTSSEPEKPKTITCPNCGEEIEV
jgi:site-specific DNA-methyltransferase (adenine-specific)